MREQILLAIWLALFAFCLGVCITLAMGERKARRLAAEYDRAIQRAMSARADALRSKWAGRRVVIASPATIDELTRTTSENAP